MYGILVWVDGLCNGWLDVIDGNRWTDYALLRYGYFDGGRGMDR